MAVQTSDRAHRRFPAWFTTRPETLRENFVNSATIWLALMAYWALTDSLIALFPPGGRPVRPDDWVTHAIFTVSGLIAIWCMHQTGFPAAWDARIPGTRRLLAPAAVGVAFGILAVVMEEITGATKIIEAQIGQPFTVAFPGSLLVYSAGAVVWETVFRLVPIPVLLWLVSTVVLRGRGRTGAFWVLAILTSAIEPGITQGPAVLAQTNGAISPAVFAAYAVHSYAFNFAAAVSFGRYGLLAAVLVRLAYYLVWHVGYGNFLAG